MTCVALLPSIAITVFLERCKLVMHDHEPILKARVFKAATWNQGMKLMVSRWCAMHVAMQLVHLLDDMARVNACIREASAACCYACTVISCDK